ncbi:MAG: TonB-dependent receptor plug domain-containing protein, partial [Gammaproteobacteria bacterium]|nr:TonB-dependent receptor plug domain-containing protein [Gammaproteobacteria bacterium]
LSGFLCLGACAGGSGAGGEGPPPVRGTGDITREELNLEVYTSAHHAIERLRRSWLRRRGARTPNNPDNRPLVYMDGVRVGRIEELFGISAEYIERISLLSPTDATTRFGTGHASGAIVIVTRRGPPESSMPVDHRSGASAGNSAAPAAR